VFYKLMKIIHNQIGNGLTREQVVAAQSERAVEGAEKMIQDGKLNKAHSY